MSASAPRTSREARGIGPGGGRWYLAALGVHVLLLGALLWLAPRWSDDGPEEEPEAPVMSERQLREVRQTVEESARSRLERDLGRLDEIRRELSAVERERLDALPPETRDPDQALAAMRRAAESLRESTERMEVGDSAEDDGPPFDQVEQRLDEALEQLPIREDAYRSLLGELDEVRSLHERARHAWTQGRDDGSELAEASRAAERRQREFERKQAEVDKRERRVGDSRDKLAQEQEKLAGYREALAEENDPDQRRRLGERIDKQLERVADRARRVEEDLAKAAELRVERDARRDRAEEAEAGMDSLQDGLGDFRASALDWERRALETQLRAIERFERLRAGELPSGEPGSAERSVAQAYEQALQREREISGSYQLWRSAELARMRGVSLAEALRQTDVVRPERPALSPEAATDSAAGLARHRQRLESVLRETSSMVSLAENLLAMARRRESRQAEGFDVALERAASRQRLASVDVSGPVVDLTALGGNGEAGGDGPGTDPTSRTGSPGNAPPPQEVRPGGIDVFARRISDTGEPARWMSPNSWYVIGPFGNPGRDHIDRSFPPESVIDLDASYVGKDHRRIRWEFQPAESAKVVPRNEESYGIWYATTELWCDAPREVWLALGSDDQGRLWVNGELVWISSSRHKDWTLGEALRRVRLEAGHNRLLYRIENGHGGMAFSLCLSLPTPE